MFTSFRVWGFFYIIIPHWSCTVIPSDLTGRAGFGQCLMAGPPGDVLAHRCAAGNGLGGAAGDTFLTGSICTMEVLLSGGSYKSNGTSHKRQFWQLVQVIFPKSPLRLKWAIVSTGHVSPPAPPVQCCSAGLRSSNILLENKANSGFILKQSHPCMYINITKV